MNFKLILLFIIISFSAKAQTFESAKENLKGKYQYISHPKNGIVTFREQNGKMGVMDSLCSITAPATFDYTEINCNGAIEAGMKVKGIMKRGYIDKSGKILIPFIYDDVYNACDSKLVVVGINNKKGAVDFSNNVKIPIEYNYITDANKDMYIVEKNKRYAVFDVEGKAITGFDFTDMERYYDGAAYVVLPDKSVTMIGLDGKQLFTALKGYNLDIYKSGIAKIRNTKTGLYGFIDKSGNFIIPCDYKDAEYGEELVTLKKGSKWGLYTRGHKAITALRYEYIFPTEHNLYVVKDKNWGIIDASGNEIIPAIYKHIELHEKKYFITENNDGKYGIFNLSGKNTIPFDYAFYRVWKQKVFATKDNKPILLDIETGKTENVNADSFIKASDAIYEKWDKQVFLKDGKYGVVSIDNQILVPAEYDALDNIYVSGEFIAKRNTKFGIINSKNEIVQPIAFDKAYIRKESVELTVKNKKPIYHSVNYRDYAIKFDKN
ncbi:WG repeat-containing protein [Flavobacterium sp. DG1-102-2]|uniref:WG repeat-containing protein n=1 Tax=Flavobacterium sp. DG1-102-2 TaxID=3081663 RepID=UPI00294B949F|nr:WG repeat-containing protein [Flavobacterium sp. DG1-102-2]